MTDFRNLAPRRKVYPLVSVIVPCYNVEDYIDQCLTSILDNGYPNLEVICVDDRCTDSTVERIKAIQRKRKEIQLLHNTLDHNVYGGACRNMGLDIAKGKYIYFCDSDDYILPGLFNECVNRCEAQHAEVCCFRHRIVDSLTGKTTEWNGCLALDRMDDRSSQMFNYSTVNSIFRMGFPEVWDKFYRKEYLDAIGARFQEQSTINDLAFYVKTMANVSIATYVDKVFYIYRKNTKTSVQSTMTKDSSNSMNMVEALKQAYLYVCEVNNRTVMRHFADFLVAQLQHIRMNYPLSKYANVQLLEFIKGAGFYEGEVKNEMDAISAMIDGQKEV